MLFQVLPLKVLVTREVIKRKMDYSSYLNGTAKEELDKLDKLAGNYRIEDVRLTIDGCSWQDLKKKGQMPNWVMNMLERKSDFSIVEKMNNGMRTWIVRSANGTEKDVLFDRDFWEETSDLWTHRESFIEDGAIVNLTKVSKMYQGERRLCLSLYHSFALDQQGKLVIRVIIGRPHLGIRVTNDILGVREDLDEKGARNSSLLEERKESEEGDAHINATLASLREAVRNGLLNDAKKRMMEQKLL